MESVEQMDATKPNVALRIFLGIRDTSIVDLEVLADEVGLSGFDLAEKILRRLATAMKYAGQADSYYKGGDHAEIVIRTIMPREMTGPNECGAWR